MHRQNNSSSNSSTRPAHRPSSHSSHLRLLFASASQKTPSLRPSLPSKISSEKLSKTNRQKSLRPAAKTPNFPFSQRRIYKREIFPLFHLPRNRQKSPFFHPTHRKINSLPPFNLLAQVAAFIERHQMLPQPAQTIGVAVSAGADSVVLLHLLHQLRSHFACHLHVLHVNHHLRGAASDADESFVRTLAASLGLPITVEHTAAPTTQIEQQARDLRRHFFQRAIQEYNLNAIALGHTRSDQAETVLFRLIRGTGLTGLAGMRPVTADRLIRPLLNRTRQEIRAWATAQNIQWRDDASNLDTTFTRNRLRLETLPALVETYNPNLEALLAQSADLAQTEEDYWHGEIEALYPQFVAATPLGLQIPVAKLASLHLALRRRLIRRALITLRGHLKALSFEHIESILELCHSTEGHNRVIIPGIDALRSFDQLPPQPNRLTTRTNSRLSARTHPRPGVRTPLSNRIPLRPITKS
jgi:tRNA(Ile)-lysidine synthetase-like protein